MLAKTILANFALKTWHSSMGAKMSACSRLPGPSSPYYPEAARYMNLAEALRSLPRDRQLEILRQLGASDQPNWDTVDIVVEVFYLALMIHIDCARVSHTILSRAMQWQAYPFCQRMVLSVMKDYVTKKLWSEMASNMARKGNPYAQLVARNWDSAIADIPYDEIASVMGWIGNSVVQKVGEQFVDLSDTEHNGSLSDLVIDRNEYLCVSRIEDRDYGDVSHVIHRKTLRNYVMKTYTRLDDIDDYMRELDRLATLNHPCVIKLKGFAPPVNSKPGILLLPYYSEGSMADKQRRAFGGPDIEKTFIGLVIGMQYLHAAEIIHRHLRPENILYDHNGYPVISDLSSSQLPEEDREAPNDRLPRYQAPEMYRPGPVDDKVDVFSFCAIMYELITGKKVFPEQDRKSIQAHCEHGDRPSLRMSKNAKWYHPVVIDIIEKGLSVNPDERYSFQEIRKKMEQVDFRVKAILPASEQVLELIRSDGKARLPGGTSLIKGLLALIARTH